jgi:primosomal protein N'
VSLRVVIGSANAGKTGVLHQRIRECAAQGGRAALLVPSAPDVTRALAELAPAVPLGLEGRTLDAFLDRLW